MGSLLSASSKWAGPMLWTLVATNALALVVGGLVTWLGYTIPVRLRQFGIASELAIAAGFAALLVACLGLCALNYSSHCALNAYGASCAIFILLMLAGALQDNWLKFAGELDGVAAAAAAQSASSAAAQTPTSATPIKLVDVIYYSLLALLLLLLVFAVALASHLRREEARDRLADDEEAEEASVACNEKSPSECSCNVAARLFAAAAAQQQLDELVNGAGQHALWPPPPTRDQFYNCAQRIESADFASGNNNRSCLPLQNSCAKAERRHADTQPAPQTDRSQHERRFWRANCAAASYDLQVPFQRPQSLAGPLPAQQPPLPPPPPLVNKGLYYASRQSLGDGGDSLAYSPLAHVNNLAAQTQRQQNQAEQAPSWGRRRCVGERHAAKSKRPSYEELVLASGNLVCGGRAANSLGEPQTNRLRCICNRFRAGSPQFLPAGNEETYWDEEDDGGDNDDEDGDDNGTDRNYQLAGLAAQGNLTLPRLNCLPAVYAIKPRNSFTKSATMTSKGRCKQAVDHSVAATKDAIAAAALLDRVFANQNLMSAFGESSAASQTLNDDLTAERRVGHDFDHPVGQTEEEDGDKTNAVVRGNMLRNSR